MDIVQIKYGYICCLSIVHMFGIRTSPMPTLYPPIIWAYPYFICPLSVHAHLISARHLYIQGSPKECFPGLVNFVTAVAYHFCLNLPRAFSQPGKHSFGDPCILNLKVLHAYSHHALIFTDVRLRLLHLQHWIPTRAWAGSSKF